MTNTTTINQAGSKNKQAVINREYDKFTKKVSSLCGEAHSLTSFVNQKKDKAEVQKLRDQLNTN